ncbi:MAG: cyclic nucleotide-binding domain-containing protein [Candidatus Polarisedimenticolaceae bacterium]|nr:cyclic nucleotide-binding domain-containing protein [Candidatus Polarisedimenticolaceae bacterium]
MGTPLTSVSNLHHVNVKHTCSICDIKKLLLKTSDIDKQSSEITNAIKCRGPFLPGDRVYKSGEPLNAIYAVTSGSVKTETITYEGYIQTTGFHLRGEIFGIEALGETHHVYDAYAIERTWLCELSISSLNSLCQQHPKTLNDLFKLIGRHARTHLNLINVRGRTADQRILDFLGDLSERLLERQQTACDELTLPMIKEDIANYLGLTPETVSRSLRRLDEAGHIHYKGKTFRLAAAHSK